MQHWRGAAYRVTTLDYPSPKDILLGQGSFLFGGRWNAAGSFRAVYGSVSDTVAVAESRANAEYAAMPFPFRTPRLLVTLELNLEKLIDLTQPETIQLLDLEQEELRAEDWRKVQAEGRESLSQCFGRAVFESGANGLLAPSARHDPIVCANGPDRSASPPARTGSSVLEDTRFARSAPKKAHRVERSARRGMLAGITPARMPR
jgi:RES domain-containing protein